MLVLDQWYLFLDLQTVTLSLDEWFLPKIWYLLQKSPEEKNLIENFCEMWFMLNKLVRKAFFNTIFSHKIGRCLSKKSADCLQGGIWSKCQLTVSKGGWGVENYQICSSLHWNWYAGSCSIPLAQGYSRYTLCSITGGEKIWLVEKPFVVW